MAGWNTVMVVMALGVGFALFGRLRKLAPTAPDPVSGPAPMPPVGIVIPARNEAATLPALLGDIARLDRAPAIVVVVDDSSDDATAERARSFADVTVIDAPGVPAGWRGKTWACHLGASRAAVELGDDGVLVFLDADVRLEPTALDALVAQRAASAGVVSVQPFHEVPTAVEQLSGLCNVVSMMGAGAGTTRPHAVFGPVVCCTVADYVAVDGHRGVRHEVNEDLALARRFLGAGMHVRVLGGGSQIRFRMYPDGLAGLVDGWTKNMAAGSLAVPLWRTLGVVWWIGALLTATSGAVGWSEVALPAATYAVTAVCVWTLLRRVGSFRWWAALAFPVLVVAFLALFGVSIWKTYVRRSVDWKGRRLDLRPADLEGAPVARSATTP